MVSYVSQCKRPTVSFVNLSQMFLDKKTVLKIWLKLGLILTRSFEETGPRDLVRGVQARGHFRVSRVSLYGLTKKSCS